MKTFLEAMTFPRAVILVCLIACIPLGWIGWKKSGELSQMETVLHREKRVGPDGSEYYLPSTTMKLVEEIQILSIQLDQLQNQADKEKLKGGVPNAEDYIRGIASHDLVTIGDVDITPSKRETTKGIVDYKYVIKPVDRERPYARSQIANFLYKLEEDSQRVRVTSIDIRPVQKSVKPHQVFEDKWTFDIEITSRQAEEDS